MMARTNPFWGGGVPYVHRTSELCPQNLVGLLTYCGHLPVAMRRRQVLGAENFTTGRDAR